jgi:uncharacterized membrane protein YeaQ/YmgE (transglycosylase-associated protein family)
MGFLLSWLVIGAFAGWIAEKITKSDHSLFVNIGVGIAGAIIAGTIYSLLGISAGGRLGSTIMAVIGALILLYGYKMYMQRQG